jgi:hypothetical protein
MSVLDGLVSDSVWPSDESTGPGAKFIGPVCEGRRSLLLTVLDEKNVTLSKRFFSMGRSTKNG